MASGVATVISTYAGLSSPPLEITFNPDSQPVLLVSLSSPVFPTTLSGLINAGSAYMNLAGTFSDGTIITSLFGSSGAIVYPNLVSFSSLDTSLVTVQSATGQVTIKGNSRNSLVKVTASSASNPSIFVSSLFACNLDPAVGDVDLGGTAGSPYVVSTSVGQTFDVIVRVNTGSSSLGAIDMLVSYDALKWSVVSVTEGLTWPGGSFVATLDSPPGDVAFGSSP
jgi:hypothetical protein